MLCLAANSAEALNIEIDLGPPGVISTPPGITVPFADLNGVALSGQTLSLEFTFKNGQFVRLFTVTNSQFVALVSLQTDAFGVAGFLEGTGYLVDLQGNALQQPESLGSASSDDGAMHAGLFPLLLGDLDRPLDFYGVHFDLTLPNLSFFSITGGNLGLIAAGVNRNDLFGIGPGGIPRDIVPESGGTLLLFIAALAAILTIRVAAR